MTAGPAGGVSAAEAAGDKRYRDGTHRTTDPDATLARLSPLIRRIGITRVGVLTGLDIVGIPVAAAYRPNSRTIAVHQGKGATLAAAHHKRRRGRQPEPLTA